MTIYFLLTVKISAVSGGGWKVWEGLLYTAGWGSGSFCSVTLHLQQVTSEAPWHYPGSTREALLTARMDEAHPFSHLIHKN